MAAADYLSIPYLDRGRDASIGLDCWGLVRHWYASEMRVQLPLLESAPSGRQQAGQIATLIAEQLAQWKPVSVPQRGDLVVIRLADRPFHVGVCVGVQNGGGQFLHACQGIGASYCNLTDPVWAPRIEGFYRHGQ